MSQRGNRMKKAPFSLGKILLICVTLSMVATISAQTSKKKKKPAAENLVMWTSVDVAGQDTFLGPGGTEWQPDISSGVTLVSEEKGGFSTKYRIKDSAGRTWVAKIGEEAQSETAAVRLLYALGYKTEINYLVPKLTIPGKGDFTNVRLEARPKGLKRLESWSWKENAFIGSRQFQGLKILMSFLNNWDMKQANNVIIRNGDEFHYVISDLGVSFGKTGSNGLPIFWRIGRSRNQPVDYAESDFVQGVESGKIKFAFNGKNDGSLGDIKREDGRWLARLLTQLTDKQIEDMFRAANYSDSDVATLSQAVKNRIRALDLATASVR